MKCPLCKSNDIAKSKQLDVISIYFCNGCGRRFKFDRMSEQIVPLDVFPYDKVPEQIPLMEVATRVYIDNKEHEFFLEHGIVVGKEHLHYRVKFVSMDERINGKKLWVPKHWVKELPKELLDKK